MGTEIRNAIYDFLCDDVITANKAPGLPNTRYMDCKGNAGRESLVMMRVCQQIREEFSGRLIGRCGLIGSEVNCFPSSLPTLIVKASSPARVGSLRTSPRRPAHLETLDYVIEAKLYDAHARRLEISLALQTNYVLTTNSQSLVIAVLTGICAAGDDLTAETCLRIIARMFELHLGAVRTCPWPWYWRPRYTEIMFKNRYDDEKKRCRAEISTREIT